MIFFGLKVLITKDNAFESLIPSRDPRLQIENKLTRFNNISGTWDVQTGYEKQAGKIINFRYLPKQKNENRRFLKLIFSIS